MPELDWAAASQHCGLIERNIQFLKEKVRSLRHSLPYERVPAIMIVRMVLHAVKFVKGFPWKGGVKLYSPGEIMTGRRMLMTFGLVLGLIARWPSMWSLATAVPLGLERPLHLTILGICQAVRHS
jgi:hypothetical protein